MNIDNYYIEQFNNAVDNMGEYDETKRKPSIFHFEEHNYEFGRFEFVLQPLSSKLEREQKAVICSYIINDLNETYIGAYILDWCDNEYTLALNGLNWIPYEEFESNHLFDNLLEYIRNVYIPAQIIAYKAENN
jgi:hypothetical protein